MLPRSRTTVRIVTLLAVWSAPAAGIVNGTVPPEARYQREFPWAVALHYEGSEGICSAALVAPQWVLTAAHCASANARVMAGARDRTAAVPVRVVEAIRHPGYDGKTGANDIGLLRLERPLALAPVPMLAKTEAQALLREGSRAVIAGYGRRVTGAGYARELVASDVVLEALRLEGTRFIFIDRASGPCGGDSGGPLLLTRADGSQALAGVASRVAGDLCAQGGGISLYMNVAELRTFIDPYVKGVGR